MQLTINIQSTSKKRTALSPLQKEYRKFVRGMIKEKGKGHPFEGSPDDIADFFFDVSKQWRKHKKTNGL